MRKSHKHAAIIKAWADGAEIEVECYEGMWKEITEPSWNAEHYRIKPEKKPDVVGYMRALFPVNGLNRLQAQDDGIDTYCTQIKGGTDNLKLTFDGETGKLKKVELI